MHDYWTLMKKLIWLRILQGASFVVNKITGTSPITLTNAINSAIISLKQYGKCVQDGTPTPSSPVDIMCNNGVIKCSANLLDPTTVPDENKYISSNNGGMATPGTGIFRHSDYIRIAGGEKYCFGITPYLASTAGLAWYNGNSYISGINGTTLKNAGMKATAPSGATHVRFSWRIDDGYDTDWEHSVYFCKCENDVPILSEWQAYGLIYVDGTPETLTVSASGAETQTVTDIPTLLSAGDYADTVDIISGGVVRKCGIHIFDGNEDISLIANRFYYQERLRLQGSQRIMCSHFPYKDTVASGDYVSTASSDSRNIIFSYGAATSVAEFKAFLRTQYATGTPVIVLYPLATETTEQTTPHELHSYVGDTTVSWTAEVDGTVKTVEYAQDKQESNKVGTAKVGTAKCE